MNSIHEIEQALERSSWKLLFENSNPDLKIALFDILGNMTCAYVIDWIPEQASDIYAVIIPPDKHVLVELPRRGFEQGQQVTVELSKFDHTALNAKGLSREKRDKLRAVANLIEKSRQKK